MINREPGTGIGGRYTLRAHRPLQDAAESAQLWHAVDEDTGDSVLLYLVAGAEAAETLDAGRRASLVSAPGLASVLDVGSDDDLTWVAYPSTEDPTLADLTSGGRSLRAETARSIIGEAARALDAARKRGLRHQVLRSDRIQIATDGTVTVLGAGVDAAAAGLAGTSAHAAQRTDATDLVRLLFLGLTGSEPEKDPETGLVPLSSWLSSRTVPEDVDRLCDDVLNPGPAGADEDASVGVPTVEALIKRLGPWQSVNVTLQSWDPDDEGPATAAMPPVDDQPASDGAPDPDAVAIGAPERDDPADRRPSAPPTYSASPGMSPFSSTSGPTPQHADTAGANAVGLAGGVVAAGAAAAAAFNHLLGREAEYNHTTAEGAARFVEEMELRNDRRPTQFPGEMSIDAAGPVETGPRDAPPLGSERIAAAYRTTKSFPSRLPEPAPEDTAQDASAPASPSEVSPSDAAPASGPAAADRPEGPAGRVITGRGAIGPVAMAPVGEASDDPAGASSDEDVPWYALPELQSEPAPGEELPPLRGTAPATGPQPIIVPGRARPLAEPHVAADGPSAAADDRDQAVNGAAAVGAGAAVASGAGATATGRTDDASVPVRGAGSEPDRAPDNGPEGENDTGRELLGVLGVAMGTDDEQYPLTQPDVATRKNTSTWILLVAVLLVLLATVFAITTISSVGRGGQGAPAAERGAEAPAAPATTEAAAPVEPEPTPTTTAPTLPPAQITTAYALADTGGPGEGDHQEDASDAVDASAESYWVTQRYTTPQFGNLRPGMGLWVEFQEEGTVTAVEVDSLLDGGRFEIRVGDPADPLSAEVIGDGTFTTSGTTLIEPDEPIEAEGIILWVTELPPEPERGDYRAEVSDIRVR